MALTPFFGRTTDSLFDRPSLDLFWDPFESFELAERSPARALARDASAIASTRVDWLETADSHVFKAELPGLKKEEIKVDVEDGNVLKISGERSREDVKKTDKWHHVERSYGQFLRKFRLPKDVEIDKVSANVENGVLTVNVPKLQVKKPAVQSIQVS